MYETEGRHTAWDPDRLRWMCIAMQGVVARNPGVCCGGSLCALTIAVEQRRDGNGKEVELT